MEPQNLISPTDPPITTSAPRFAIYFVAKEDSSSLAKTLRDDVQNKASRSSAAPIVLTTLQEAETYLAQNEKRSVLVLYRRPDLSLGAAFASGIPVNEAVNACEAQIQTLLNLVRLDRRRIILIEERAASSHPRLLAEILHSRFGYKFPSTNSLAAETAHPNLYGTIGRCVLLDRLQYRRDMAELEASTLVFVPTQDDQPGKELTTSELVELVRDVRRLSSLEADFAGLAKAEVMAASRTRELIDRISKLEERLGKASRENEQLSKAMSTAKAERLQAITREKNANQGLKDLRASLSWRLMTPARAVERSIGHLHKSLTGRKD